MINRVNTAPPVVSFQGAKEIKALVEEALTKKPNQASLYKRDLKRRIEKEEIDPKDLLEAAKRIKDKIIQKAMQFAIKPRQ